jgi:hypothetical protein
MGKAIPMGRTRPASNPWLTITNGDWTWKVLQAHVQDPDQKYASWFCVVTTPYTGSLGDMGDTYISEVQGFVTQRDPSVPDEALPRHLRRNAAKSVTRVNAGFTIVEVGD